MTDQQIDQSQQENILAILCFKNGETATFIADTVKPELFDGDYRTVAEKAMEYRGRHHKAPGEAHAFDFVDDLFRDERKKARAETLRQALLDICELAKNINEQHVVDNYRKFLRDQQSDALILKVAEAKQSGRIDEYQQAIEKLHEVNRGVALDIKSKHSWDDPDRSLLDDQRGDLPAFPIDAFDKLNCAWLQDWAERAAEGTGTTIDHVMVPLLGISSAMIGASRRVQVTKAWREPVTVWTNTIGWSGEGKTPSLDATHRGLSKLEFDLQEKIEEARRTHKRKKEMAEMAKAAWKKDYEKAAKEKKPLPVKPSDADDPEEFVAPKLFVSNATTESIHKLLQARPQGMLIIRDELADLFANMARYSKGQDDGFWLQSWDGKPYPIERVGRPAINLPHLLMGIVGGMQPDKLPEAFKTAFDGMPQRFLHSWPPSPPYRPLSDNLTSEDDDDIADILGILSRLGDDAGRRYKCIPLTPLAREAFERFRKRIREHEMPQYAEREREWLAKAEAQVIRLAGTLTFLHWAIKARKKEPTEIRSQYVKAAIRLVRDYFWPHARAALRQIGLNQRHSEARRVLRYLVGRNATEITRETIRRDALGQRLDASDTESLLTSLERAGWLHRDVAKPGAKGGRPSIKWIVNPKLHEGNGK
jgi:hypothetical protein